MGVLDWFVETKKENKTKVVIATPQPATSSIPIPADVSDYEKKIVDILVNQPDTKAFFEFMNTKQAMKFGGAEGDGYNALFAVFALKGMTKDVVINSANRCLEDTAKEVVDFSAAYRQQCSEQENRKSSVLDDKRAKITETEAFLAKLKSEVAEIQEDTTAKLAQLSSQQTAFVTAGSNLQSKFKEEINKITKYIN